MWKQSSVGSSSGENSGDTDPPLTEQPENSGLEIALSITRQKHETCFNVISTSEDIQ